MTAPRPMNTMTVDVEDWYHPLDQEPGNWPRYEDRIVPATRRVLSLLDAARTTATFFVLGHVAERHPELVWEIHRAGHEVASHGHEHRFVYRQSEQEFEADVARSAGFLRGLVGQPVNAYRAPYFSITARSRWALGVLHRLGFAYDSSIYPVFNHRYGIPSAPRQPHRLEEGLTELPIATFPIGPLNLPCGGGVYFRFLPYAITRRLFARLNARGEKVVFYLHPWELDAGQPRIPLPPALGMRHYWGLAGTERKLALLLRDLRFGSVRDVFGP